MNKEQFIFWLKGFAKAINEEGPTQGQWNIIASELEKIDETMNYDVSYNTPWPNKIYPADPYKVTCTTSTATYKANVPEEDHNLPSSVD
jgi:hypothetical protein